MLQRCVYIAVFAIGFSVILSLTIAASMKQRDYSASFAARSGAVVDQVSCELYFPGCIKL